MNKSMVSIAGVAVLGLALTACGEPKEVSGLRDDVRYTKAVKAVPAVTHKESKQVAKYKTVCTRYVKGSCKSSTRVFDGYKNETKVIVDKPGKPGKSAVYCVELDHVKDGDSYRDDVWFNVDSAAYYSAFGKSEGASISKMKYNHEGC